MNSSITHVSTVKRLISTLLPKFGNERKNQYELSLIAKRIKKNNSNLYSPVSGKVLPDFSKAIYKLMLNLEYFKPVLESSVGAEDPHKLEEFQKKLLNRILHSKKITLEMMDFDKIREETFREKAQGHIPRIQALFKVRFKSLTAVKASKIHQGYRIILQLWMLSSFDFKQLLSKMQKKKNSGEIKFTSYYSDIILDELKDLYFLYANFKPGKIGLNTLEFISTMQMKTPINKQELLSHYIGIQDFVDKTIPPELLADIIRSASLNPFVELKKQEVQVNFIDKIKSDISNSFRNNLDNFQKMIEERAYRTQIDQLFQNRPMLSVEGYSIQTSKILSSNGLSKFRYITALRLIKTFSISFYDKEVKDLITYFIDKVDFISPAYQDRLLVYQTSCNELSSTIEKFEIDLTDPGLSKLLPIIKQCTENSLTPEEHKQFEKTIANINKQALNIIEAGTSGYHNIMQAGIKSLVDIRSKTPEIINNCRYIREKESEFLVEMEKAVEKLTQFIKIMSHFSINKEQARQWKDNVTKGVIKYG